jgi:mycothiol synthase
VNLPAGYRARPARPDDIQTVVRLFEAYDLADAGRIEPMRAYFEWAWALDHVDLAMDTQLVLSDDGVIAAYGEVRGFPTHTSIDASGRVHPDHAGRGLGRFLVAWAERRVASVRAARPQLRTIWHDVSATDAAAHDLLRSAGYLIVRRFHEMERTLEPSEPPGPVPEGVGIRPFAEDDEHALYEVLEESFRGHFGWEPTPFEDWRTVWMGSPTWEPQLVFLAEAGGRPVGALAAITVDASAGFVAQVGVVPEHRGRGIAQALLSHAFAVLANRGLRTVTLGVDVENATGAVRLYERVGMTVRRTSDVFEKSLG